MLTDQSNLPFSRQLKNIIALSLLTAILIAGIFLRAINLDFGLPYFYHSDEKIKLGNINSVIDGSPRMLNYRHPGFLVYSSAATVKLLSFTGKHPIYLARCLIVAECMLVIIILYFSGLRLGGRTSGLFAALVIALSPLTVTASQHVKEDIPLMLWLSLQLYLCLAFLASEKKKTLYAAALAGGFAFSSKYVGSFSLLLIYLVIRWKTPKGQRQRLIMNAFLIFSLGFLVFSPFALLDIHSFLKDFFFELGHALRGHSGLKIYPWKYYWTYHLTNNLNPALTWYLLVVCLVGVFISLFKDSRYRIVATGFLLFYFLHESFPLKPPHGSERYMISVLPYLALAGGAAFHQASKIPRTIVAFWGIIALLGFFSMGNESYHYVLSRGEDDARTRARQWAVKNIPKQSLLLVDDYHNPFSPFAVFQKEYPNHFAIRTTRRLPTEELFALIKNRKEQKYRENISSHDEVYYIACNLEYDRYFDFPDYYKQRHEFYKYLFSCTEEIAVFLPTNKTYGLVDPEIRVFKMIKKQTCPDQIKGSPLSESSRDMRTLGALSG